MSVSWMFAGADDTLIVSDIYSSNSEIYFNDQIDQKSINTLIKTFNAVITASTTAKSNIMSKNDEKLHISLYIDSPGGNVTSCFKFIDYINIVRKIYNIHLTTICTGIVASAGTLIAVIGDIKYITENAMCMIHELFGMNYGMYTHLTSRMKEIEFYHTRIIKIYMENNKKINKDVLTKYLTSETWFSAEEYIDAGFVDAIYS